MKVEIQSDTKAESEKFKNDQVEISKDEGKNIVTTVSNTKPDVTKFQ